MKLLSRLTTPSDQRLLDRAGQGDERALARLYQAQVDGLYAFVFYRVGRDPALAEDVVQETFTQALTKAGDYDPERGSMQSWLCTLSRNVIRDHLKQHRRSDELAAAWDRIDESLAQIFTALDQVPLTDEVIARDETRDLVNMTIANLPEKYREVLHAKYVEGSSLSEMAKKMELSEDAIKSQLARARRAFRETFDALCRALVEA